MDDDEFMKELNEATSIIQNTTEAASKKNTAQPEQKETPKNTNTQNKPNTNPTEDEAMKMLMGMLNLNQEDLKFDENDPEFISFQKEFQESMKDFSGKNSDETFDKIFKEMGGANFPSAPQNENSNPYSETFSQMNNDSGFGDMEKMLLNTLGKLSSNMDNNDQEPNEEGLNMLINGIIDSLIKNDLLKSPLTQMKETVKKHLESEAKIDAEKRKQYEEMISHIDIILAELQKTDPNRELIIDKFMILNGITDLDDKVFADISPEVSNLLGPSLFGNMKK